MTAKVIDQTSTVSQERNKLQSLFSEYEVSEYYRTFEWADNHLQYWRSIFLQDKTRINDLRSDLLNLDYFEKVLIEYEITIAECDNPVPYNDPGSLQTDHFEKMNLPCAWNISQGNPNIGIGVLDMDIDNSHTDLIGKINSINGTCNTTILDNCTHGYSVSGGIVGIKDNDYCVVGTAPDSRVDFWCSGSNPESCKAVSISTSFIEAMEPERDLRIINVSASSVTSNTDAILDYCEERGNTLVLAAANSWHAAIADIPGVILVGQATSDGNAVDYNPNDVTGPDLNIDIYVPSLNLVRLENQSGCGFGSGNSSMAAPFLTGVISLMYDVNPCLRGGEAETLLKETTQPIANGDTPPWDVWLDDDVGLLDAEAAVLAAQNPTVPEITTEVIWDVPRLVKGNVIIKQGGILRINTSVRFMTEFDRIIV